MSDCRTFPLKQGDLDYLCSIYAAINLRHWRGTMSGVDAADKLFRKLISEQLRWCRFSGQDAKLIPT